MRNLMPLGAVQTKWNEDGQCCCKPVVSQSEDGLLAASRLKAIFRALLRYKSPQRIRMSGWFGMDGGQCEVKAARPQNMSLENLDPWTAVVVVVAVVGDVRR